MSVDEPSPATNERSERILAVARAECPNGTLFQVLEDTPEQLEDIVRVLVDDQVVVGFDLVSNDAAAAPRDVVLFSVVEYARRLKGRAAKDFKMTIDYARRQLGRV